MSGIVMFAMCGVVVTLVLWNVFINKEEDE